MLGIQLVIGLFLFGIGALGARLAYCDNVPQQPRFLYHGLTRRRRGLIVEYPPGVARLAGIALLLYALGLALISINILNVISGSNPPGWSSLGGWPLLIGVLLSIYVMLRLRRPTPPAETDPAPDVEKLSVETDAAPEAEKRD